MGLDNGFILHSKRCKECKFEYAYFRKYYELNDWVMSHGEGADSSEYEVTVTADVLTSLLTIIEPIAVKLMKLDESQVDYYDANGYPKEYEIAFFGNEFDPTTSSTSFSGSKLLRLYSRIQGMLELLAQDTFSDAYFTFYSSF